MTDEWVVSCSDLSVFHFIVSKLVSWACSLIWTHFVSQFILPVLTHATGHKVEDAKTGH